MQIAKALADPTRRRMVGELRAAGELTCSCMCGRFELAQPTISHHIKTLESAGIVRVRRAGAYHVLSLDEVVLAAFASAVAGAPVGGVGRAKGESARRASVKRAAGKSGSGRARPG